VVTPATSRLERTLWKEGFELVAGCDEAGRGALAGPLVAAAVILPFNGRVRGLRDSKQLTPLARERMFDKVLQIAVARSVVFIENERVDQLGVHHANLVALQQAIRGLAVVPDYVLADGFALPDLSCPSLAVPGGDSVSVSIAAASILAKVSRDRMMEELDRAHPAYGFFRHKGYATSEHYAALREHGPSPLHRRSFLPVADCEEAYGEEAERRE